MKVVKGIGGGILSLAAGLTASLCHAESLPKWEIGAGFATVSAPDYPGSDVRNTRVFPVPYFVYRGDFFKAGRGGLRGTLFDTDTIEVSLSLIGTLPSRSHSTRRTPSDGRATVGIGPAVNVDVWNSSDKKLGLFLHFPVRTSVTVQSSPQEIGWTFSPALDLHVQDPARFPGWKLGVVTGILINDRKYNAHYYSVAPADVTSLLPAYTSPGGYSGAQATMFLSKHFRRYWVGSFIRYETVAGAVFENSPFVKRRGGLSVGFAASWVLWESSTMVNVGAAVSHEAQ